LILRDDSFYNIGMAGGTGNIFLTGFMGTGKTQVGRELARLLNMRFVDLDAEIEKTEKISIEEIFCRFGEHHFRAIETEKLRTLSKGANLIVSTGGGAVIKAENRQVMRESGVVVCLAAIPETIFGRVRDNGERPLLQVEDPLVKIKELLESRRSFYEESDITVCTENKTPLQVAEEIIEKVEGYDKDRR
jgi:shikimate kinase